MGCGASQQAPSGAHTTGAYPVQNMPRPTSGKTGQGRQDGALPPVEGDFSKPVKPGQHDGPGEKVADKRMGGWVDEGAANKGAYPAVPQERHPATSSNAQDTSALTKQVAKLEQEVSSLHGQLAKVQQDYANACNAREAAKKTCAERDQELQGCNRTIQGLQQQVAEEQGRVARRNQQVAVLEQQVTPLQQQVASLQQLLRDKEAALVRSQQLLEAANLATATAQSGLEAKERELQTQQQRADEHLRAQVDAANRAAEQRYQALEAQLVQARADAERRVAEEKQQSEQVKQSYARLEDQHNKLCKEYTDFKSMFKVHVDLSTTGVYDAKYSKDALRGVLDNVLSPQVDEAARKYQEAFPSLAFSYDWLDLSDMNDKKRAMLVRRMLKHVLYCLLEAQLWGVPNTDTRDVRSKLMPPSTDAMIVLFSPGEGGGDAYLNKLYDVQRDRARTMLAKLTDGKATREVAQLASSLHAHFSSLLSSGGGDLVALARRMGPGDKLPPASAPSGSEAEAAMVEMVKAAVHAQLMAWSVHPEVHLVLLGFHTQGGGGAGGLAPLGTDQERMVEVRSEYKAAAGVDGPLVLSCDVPAACYTLEPGRVKLGDKDSQVVCVGGVYLLAHC